MEMARWQIRDDPFMFIYCCFWTVVLEKTLKSPWDCKEIRPVNPKGNQPWNVQNGVLKSLSFLFEYIGEMGKDYIYAVTPLLEDALMDR